MELVEGPLAQQHHQLGAVQRAGPPVEVVVDQAAAGQVEALVEPAELVPQALGRNSAELSPIGPNQPRPDDAGQRAHLEELVAVAIPVDAGQQLVLGRLVPAGLGRRPCGAPARGATPAWRPRLGRPAGRRAAPWPAGRERPSGPRRRSARSARREPRPARGWPPPPATDAAASTRIERRWPPNPRSRSGSTGSGEPLSTRITS